MSKFLCKHSICMNYLLAVWSLSFFNSTFIKFSVSQLNTIWKQLFFIEWILRKPNLSKTFRNIWGFKHMHSISEKRKKENVFSAPLTTPSRQLSFVVMTPHKKCAKNFQWITFFRVLRKNSLKNRFLLFFVMSSAKHETWGKAH